MTIRLLTAQDGPEFQALRLMSLETNPEAFLTVLSDEQTRHEHEFSEELDSYYHPPHFGYYGIWTSEGQLAGYCLLSPTWLPKQPHVAFLYNLYIDPQFRHQGLAEQLLRHLTMELAAAGIEFIYITCAATNQPALRFYRKHGFQRHGLRRDSIKWQGKVDSEVELVLRLTAQPPISFKV